jgi:putative SOS response-associated peptidase YedK
MALHHPLPDVIAYFQLARGPALTPRYNLAPSQAIPVIRQEGAERVLTLLRWGLVPPWAKDVAIGHKLINARAETLLAKRGQIFSADKWRTGFFSAMPPVPFVGSGRISSRPLVAPAG